MMPKDLEDQLKIARDYLKQDPNGDLPLHQRAPILKLMGVGRPDLDDPYPSYAPGHVRRYRLMKACAEKVLFIWEDIVPIDKTPHLTLQIADGFIQRDYPPDYDEMKPLLSRIISCVESNPDIGLATLSGWSVVNAFQISQLDTDVWENENADTMEDIDDEIYGWSADFSASLAYAGGFPDDDDADNNRRREFWEWYLNQAVEEAYESVS